MSQLNYKKKCVAMGRNGTSKQIGLDIFPSARIDKDNKPFDVFILSPINSYGQVTNGWIEIPYENIDELIEHLIFLRDDNPSADTRV